MALGKPSTEDLSGGDAMAHGNGSCAVFSWLPINGVSWITPNGTSIQRWYARRARLPGQKKGVDTDEPRDHALGLSRGGRGTKVHLATDRHGWALGFVLTGGQAGEAPLFPALIERTRRTRPRKGLPSRLAGDKAYNSGRIRDWLARRRILALIPPRAKKDRLPWTAHQKRYYRDRNVVERCVGKLKEFRRLATRYEKLAVNFAAMVTLGLIRIYLRGLWDTA
jgi:transposase